MKLEDTEPPPVIVREIKVMRKVGLALIGDAIEVDEFGDKVKDISAEVWVSDPNPDPYNYTTKYTGAYTPEPLSFCEGCETGSEEKYGIIDMGFGTHFIEFTRTGSHSHEDEPEYNYYKPCVWEIDAEMGAQLPNEGEENDCGIEVGGEFIPRLERKAPPEYTLGGTIRDCEIPTAIFVTDDYLYTFLVVNTSESDVDTLSAEYRVTLRYISKDIEPEKIYEKVTSWKRIAIGESSNIPLTYALSGSAVPSDMVYVMYDIYGRLEIDKNSVKW